MSSWRRGKAYAQDLRDRVLSVDGVASGQVAARFGVSISYVVKARQRRDRLGAVTPGAQRSHTRPKLAGHEAVIRAQVRLLPDMTLDKLRAWILKELGISVSITTVWKTLRRLELGSSNDLSFYVRQAARRCARLRQVDTRNRTPRRAAVASPMGQ